MEEIVAADRNYKGEIISFQTSSGRVISYRKALHDIQAGLIQGVQVIEENDTELPKITQMNDEYSLADLPTIH
ncbi:DUF3892 domain-containing protein [Bacillus kwashiorkori]|uniref:DUF3892 domain-containing protein n=1 Tax=Bacillus kwashiorkori TaxID=1522318 RepID=UPI0007823180|nr:DUF3892 domain-containing protein [Bacillus kwashiorkori]